MSIAAVPRSDVQRPILSGRNVDADRGCGRNGLHGAGSEPHDVAPVRGCDEESKP